MSKAPTGVFLLLGPESGLKDEFVDNIRAGIKAATGEDPEEHRVYPYKADVGEVVSILRNTALFSLHRLVVMADVHEYKKTDDVSALAGYCSAPAPDATLILMSDGYKVDRRIDKAVAKDRRKVFWEMFDSQKRSWLQEFFRSRQTSITADAADMLLELVENDTRDLRRECERLILFLGEGTVVDEESVERHIYHSKEENVFTLFERLADRDFAGALEVLQAIRLSGDGAPVQLLGGLTWQIRRLLSVAYLIDNHFAPEEAFSRESIRGKKNQGTYRNGARKYRVPEIEAMMAAIAEYEEYLRSSKAELQHLYLELFLYQCIEGRRPMRQAGSADVVA